MAKRKGFKIPGLSFSAKRALGITKAKQKLARKTGIPSTKAGLQRKIGNAATGGCLSSVFLFMAFVSSLAAAAILFRTI
jgi:hypothetical protein